VFFCVAACVPASELPSFDEATRQLDQDASALLTEAELSAAERSKEIEDASCVPGQVRRLFQAEGEVTEAGLLDKLQAMGYAKVVDDLDLRDDNGNVFVLRNPRTNLTFELTVLSGQQPNIRIVGKTTCYEPERSAP
jgi:hypothetical protein